MRQTLPTAGATCALEHGVCGVLDRAAAPVRALLKLLPVSKLAGRVCGGRKVRWVRRRARPSVCGSSGRERVG